MLSEIAAAVVAGLLTGAGALGAQAIADAYDFAKARLKAIVPTFAPEAVTPQTQDASTAMLAAALVSVGPDRLKELSEAFRTLADATGDVKSRQVFDTVINFEGVLATEGDVRIVIEGGRGSEQVVRDVRGRNVSYDYKA